MFGAAAQLGRSLLYMPVTYNTVGIDHYCTALAMVTYVSGHRS